MKIDAHIHLYDPEAGSFSWPEPGSRIYRRVLPSDFVSVAEPYGITRSVVVACTTQPEQTALILETMQDHPAVGAVIGFIEADASDFIKLHDRFSAFEKFRGFRFLAVEAPNEQVYRNAAHLAGKQANVLEFLGGVEGITQMSGLIEANPDVNFVIEHFARTQTDAKVVDPAFLELLRVMAAYDHVHMKVSALIPLAAAEPAPTEVSSYFPVLEAAYRAFGEDRCIFGSDWPNLELNGEFSTAVEATEAFLATMPSGVLEKVMFKNAERLYKLK